MLFLNSRHRHKYFKSIKKKNPKTIPPHAQIEKEAPIQKSQTKLIIIKKKPLNRHLQGGVKPNRITEFPQDCSTHEQFYDSSQAKCHLHHQLPL